MCWIQCRRVYFRVVCFFEAEDGIRDLVRSRGLGDVYKRQAQVVRLVLKHGTQLVVEIPQQYIRRVQFVYHAHLSLIHI